MQVNRFSLYFKLQTGHSYLMILALLEDSIQLQHPSDSLRVLLVD